MTDVTYYLNEYKIWREYGGPEEGGWWYNVGSFVKCHGRYTSIDEATAADEALVGYVSQKRVGQRPPSSVLGTGWTVTEIETHPGRNYPEVRPRYE